MRYDYGKIPPGNMSADARRRLESRESRRKWMKIGIPVLIFFCLLMYGVKGDSQTIATICDTYPARGYIVVTSDGTFKVDNIFWAFRGQGGNAELFTQIKKGKTYVITYEGMGAFTPHNIVRVNEAAASEAIGTCA